MAWTDQEVEKLIELIGANYTFKQIGEELGKTKNTIAGKCFRMQLKADKPIKSGPTRKNPAILLKSDKKVLAQIKKHSDTWGWGLELDEIMEYTRLPFNIVLHSIKRLIRDGYLNTCKSYVADHIFYNDASVKQIGA